MELGGKKVLVTGANGFIGSHLTEELVRRGCDVRAFVHYNSAGSWGWLDHSPKEVRSRLDVLLGDITDPFGVNAAAADCEVIFHLAALIAIPHSYRSPSAYVDTNVRGTLNVVQAAQSRGTRKVVVTSTSETYGTARYVPIDEEHPLQGQSPYSATKIGADQLALSYHRSFGTPVAIIRPFNTYGPRQSARAVIPTIITQIAKGETLLRLGALAPTRDFNFVEDTVGGFIAIAESDDAVGEVINIGSGFEISIGDTAALIAELMDRDIRIECQDERLRPKKSEVERLCASNTKAKRIVGWTPRYGGRDGLRRGLQKTIEWFKEPQNLSRYKTDLYTT
jgi:NAD dependent epimerase/dehydratase